MDAAAFPIKSDVVSVTSEPRPTATPVRTSFSEVMARSAGSVVGGAESAMTTLPGTSVMAVALRGGAAGVAAQPLGGVGMGIGGIGGLSPLGGLPGVGGLGAGPSFGGLNGGLMAEGPGATGSAGFGAQFLASATAASSSDGGAAASLQQSQQSNLYYLQLQQEVSQQSQTFETLSNFMKSESDTVKNAIGNMQ